jgi:hypothetical protein
VRFKETCLTVIVVVAKVRDEVLYTFATSSTLSLPNSCARKCEAAPRPLHYPLAGTLGSSSTRGRKLYMRARAKLADYNDTRHGEARFVMHARCEYVCYELVFLVM